MTVKREIHIIDTSVLLSAGSRALFASHNTEVVLPFAVINELEHKRNDPILGYAARGVLREVETLREQYGVALLKGKGVLLDKKNSVYLKVEGNHVDEKILPTSVRNRSANDMRILAVAMNLKADESNSDANITLITNDLPLRITAHLIAEINVSKLLLPKLWQGDFTGIVTDKSVPPAVIDSLFSDKSNVRKGDFELDETAQRAKNVAFVLSSGSQSVTARVNPRTSQIRKIDSSNKVGSIRTRGVGQHIAMNYLLDSNIEVVSLGGRAGTGKTMLSVAAGLAQLDRPEGRDESLHALSRDKNSFERVLVFRSLFAVGNQNLGYLPGTEEEKMSPWAGAIDDVLEAIYPNDHSIKERIKREERLVVLPITHIRGRTFTNTMVVIDEAQNYDVSTLLNIISRLGQGSKVVLCWDAAQSDNLSVSAEDGVMTLVDKYLAHDNFAHVTLTESQRSRVAEQASIMLEEVSAM